MGRLNILLTGHDITDEVINRADSTALPLAHDTIRGTADLEIWTGAGGTGTQLTLTTDYTVGTEDTRLTTAAGVTVYTKLAIVNGAYHDTDLYVTYKTVGDYASVESVVAIACPAGSMIMTAAAAAPDGWLLCNGQALSRETYGNLFNAIGTTYGVGDGSTTFNLPDMREASPYGVGTYSAVTGTTHGAITAHDAIALGEFADDRLHGHKHASGTLNFAVGTGATGSVTTNAAPAQYTGSYTGALSGDVADPKTDGTNGTPRTGATTRGKILGLNFIIKY